MIQLSDLEENRSEWLHQVKKGNSKAIELLYKAYRDKFVEWLMQQTNCRAEEALDIFQESVLLLYKYIQTGKLTHFKSSVKWYLFRIGKNLFIKRKKKKRLEVTTMEYLPEIADDILVPSLREDITDEQEAYLLKLLRHLRNPCSSILHLYYYEKRKVKDIAEEIGYKNANIVSIQKGRCINKLRQMVEKKFGKM